MATRKKINVTRKMSDAQVLETLNDAVSAEYWEDGCKAGLVTSKIQNEPAQYYVAVARYPHGPAQKVIVCSEKADTFSDALRGCAKKWIGIVMPPPKENLKEKLAGGL